MTPQEMSAIRNKRWMDAMNLKKPDRIPLNFSGQGDFKWIDPKATLADWFRRPEYVNDLLIESAKLPLICEIDSAPGCGSVSVAGQTAFAAMFFAGIKLPGRELPDDALWNIDEQGPMTVEDYDTVIDKGWNYMTAELYKRIGFDFASLPPMDMEYMGKLMGKVAELGKANMGFIGGLLPFPSFEVLSGARKLPEFFKDLRRIPDKVKAVIEIMNEDACNNMVKAVEGADPNNGYGFIGGTRAGSDFISSKIYETYYHSFYQKVLPEMNKKGIKMYLHNDSNWDGFMHYFTEFPKASLVWDPDQLSSIAKAKEVLGHLFCIEGDVPPALLAVGTPDDCYKYAKNLINIMGDTGFIMAAGCSVPPNAKLENVQAVVSATIGK